ncbi:SufE family protein [Georgenia alba]|uniref:SufE family protein n=1 Tax=Georgenia alba TaxID=2233858 RepID=A0ABW2Q489_9MICO
MTADATTALPDGFAAIVEDFNAVPEPERLQMLLDFSRSLPALPERYADHPELLEPVPECQSPIFVIAEVEGSGDDAQVRLFFSAPEEAPTTRGFAGILHEGLDGLSAADVLTVPADVSEQLGLSRAVSPLRLRGMAGMLGRIQRQVREKSAG